MRDYLVILPSWIWIKTSTNELIFVGEHIQRNQIFMNITDIQYLQATEYSAGMRQKMLTSIHRSIFLG